MTRPGTSSGPPGAHALWAVPIGVSLLALVLWLVLDRLDLAAPVAAAGCLGVLAVSAVVRRGPRPASAAPKVP